MIARAFQYYAVDTSSAVSGLSELEPPYRPKSVNNKGRTKAQICTNSMNETRNGTISDTGYYVKRRAEVDDVGALFSGVTD